MSNNIVLPSKPKVIHDENVKGTFEIDGLYPGYGHTLGNSLRRIILSSLHGAAITSVKIDGVPHEFYTLDGVKEDIITIILNLKNIRIKSHSENPLTATLNVSGEKVVTAADIELPSQLEILNPEAPIATITNKNTSLKMELTIEQGLGFVPAELHKEDRTDIGTIILDADFTPVRRVNYEVENMRVGDRTDFNRLRIFVETDGTYSAKEALERSIVIMIEQLKAIVGFVDEEEEVADVIAEDVVQEALNEMAEEADREKEESSEFLKTRIEDLNLSSRVTNALIEAKIRTVGGLARKKADDVLDLPGLGQKGLDEIRDVLNEKGIELS